MQGTCSACLPGKLIHYFILFSAVCPHAKFLLVPARGLLISSLYWSCFFTLLCAVAVTKSNAGVIVERGWWKADAILVIEPKIAMALIAFAMF